MQRAVEDRALVEPGQRASASSSSYISAWHITISAVPSCTVRPSGSVGVVPDDRELELGRLRRLELERPVKTSSITSSG